MPRRSARSSAPVIPLDSNFDSDELDAIQNEIDDDLEAQLDADDDSTDTELENGYAGIEEEADGDEATDDGLEDDTRTGSPVSTSVVPAKRKRKAKDGAWM